MIATFAYACIGCPNPGDSPSGATAAHLCDTDGLPATSGGDHGGPWYWAEDVPLGDDTSEPEKLDVSGVAPADDPDQWEYDSASGVYYRSPTDAEMTAYGWTSRHLLVIPNTSAFLRPVTQSSASATVSLPVHDNAQSRPQRNLDIATVAVSKQYSHNAIPYLQTRITTTGSIVHETLFPTMALYLPTGISWSNLPERVIAVMGSSRGGIELQGATDIEQYWVRGPFKDGVDVDLDIAPPVGTNVYVQYTVHDYFFSSERLLGGSGVGSFGALMALADPRAVPDELAAVPRPSANQDPIGQCVDGLDNDPDGYGDACDYNCVVHKDFGGGLQDYKLQFEYSKDYALIGDLDFCHAHPNGSAEAFMDLIAAQANSILNNLDPPTEYAPPVRAPPFRMTVRGCFLWDGATQAQIDACHMNAANCPAGLNYPQGGTLLTSQEGIYEAAWPTFDALIENKSASGIRPVHIVAMATHRNIEVEGSTNGFNPSNYAENGRLVVSDESTNQGGSGATLAHEIGHTLGLAHDAAPYEDSDLLWGFMFSGHHAPVLDWDAPSNVCTSPSNCLEQGVVWRDSVPSKFFPRPSGFTYTGCANATDCETGHPGLGCNVSLGSICWPE